MSGRLKPRIDLINVDLPLPFGPMIPTSVPAGTSNEISSKAGEGP